jgi:hypothetical protein
VDWAGEWLAQAARGVSEAAAVELSSVARERLISGAVEQPDEPVEPSTPTAGGDGNPERRGRHALAESRLSVAGSDHS